MRSPARVTGIPGGLIVPDFQVDSARGPVDGSIDSVSSLHQASGAGV